MEVQALTLVISEQDLNDLLKKHLPPNQPIEDLTVAIAPDGVTATGVYPLFINVQFETRWALEVANGQVAARLDHFKAMGVPGNIFKSAIVKLIEDLAHRETWIRRDGDTLYADAEALLAREGVPVRLNLKQIECQPGRIVMRAGSATPSS